MFCWCCGSILISYTTGGRFEPFYCTDSYFCQWIHRIQWKHLGKTQLFLFKTRICMLSLEWLWESLSYKMQQLGSSYFEFKIRLIRLGSWILTHNLLILSQESKPLHQGEGCINISLICMSHLYIVPISERGSQSQLTENWFVCYSMYSLWNKLTHSCFSYFGFWSC